MSTEINKINIINQYNYVGVFLTLDCNLSCNYCINKHSSVSTFRTLSENMWIEAINRLVISSDMAITLQGGEPTLHPSFYNIIKGINKEINLDLLTNSKFSVEQFIKNIPSYRFNRESIYPSIRISFHPTKNKIEDIIEKALYIKEHGHKVGIYAVNHPLYKEEINHAQKKCKASDLIFKKKEFLGEYAGKLYGTYGFKYTGTSTPLATCNCITTDLLIAPDGDIYRCHYELYNKINHIGNILDQHLVLSREPSLCNTFGRCNPCDLKIKTDRFQKHGHCSVTVSSPPTHRSVLEL